MPFPKQPWYETCCGEQPPFFAKSLLSYCFRRNHPIENKRVRSSLRDIIICATDEQINDGLLRMQRDGLDSDIDDERRMFEFLYIKGVLREDRNRKQVFMNLLDPEKAMNHEMQREYRKTRRRILRLLVTHGDYTSEYIAEGVQSLQDMILSVYLNVKVIICPSGLEMVLLITSSDKDCRRLQSVVLSHPP